MQNNLTSLTEKIKTKAEQEQQETEAILKQSFQSLQENLSKLSKNVLNTTENAIHNNLLHLEHSIKTDCQSIQSLFNSQYRKALLWSITIILITSLTIAGIISFAHFQIKFLRAELLNLKEQTEQTEAEYLKVWNRFKGLESYPYQGENYLLTPQNWQITLYGTKGKQNVWKISKD